MKCAFLLALMGLACPVAFGQGDQRVTLVVDVNNAVTYRSDVIDPGGRGTTATQTAAPPNLTFATGAVTAR